MFNFFLFGDMTEALSGMAAKFLSAIPNIVGALVIFIVGLIIAKIIAKILTNILRKIHIDKIGDKLNEIEIVSKSNINIKISTVVSKFVYYFLLLFIAIIATDVLGMPAVSQIVSDIFNFIPSLIMAIVILIVGLLISEGLSKIILTACQSLGIPSAKLLSTCVFYFLFINILILALGQAKINTAFLSQNISILIGGVVFAFAIGYGLASKDFVANLLASFYSKDKFSIGDVITLGDDKGKVIDINKSAVTLQTEDRKIIYPLSKIITQKIELHNQ